MHVTLWHGTNACHTVAWYQCMSHYGMVPMHVTLWHDTNVCHTMAWYQCMSHYGMASMHVTCKICIMSLLMPWHNTTSVNTKTICVPLLRLMPWYGSYHYQHYLE